MTDEEIEKAVKICESEKLPCQDCAYWKISTQGYNCRNVLIRDMHDYINRLKVENENMHGELMSYKAYIDNYEEIWKSNAERKIRKDTAKEILETIKCCQTVSNVRGKRYNRYELDQKDFENIADRYGVEVDE